MSNFLNFAGNSGVTFKTFTASGSANYTLDKSASTNSVLVSVGGVLQKPGTDYTVSGATLTTTSTVTSGIVIDTYIIHDAGNAPVIEDNSIVTAKIADNQVTGAKIAMGSDAQGDVMYYNGSDWARLAAGTNGHFLKTQGTSANPAWASASAQPTMMTKQASTSGTSIDFTSIPAGTRQIVMLLDQVSLSGTAEHLVQLGDSGGVETSGYGSTVFYFDGNSSWSNSPVTNGLTFISQSAATTMTGFIEAFLVDAGTYNWVMRGQMYDEASNEGALSMTSKTLSAELDRIRLTTTNGSDTFDAGNVNVHYW